MLACPHCALPLTLSGTGAKCPAGHSFDRGRGGYLNLLVGGRLGPTVVAGDTPDALAARRRFLTAGHYAPIAAALAAAVGVPAGPVLDVGCGEGHYLSTLEVVAASGVGRCGMDISKAAVQMAARAHPGVQFVVANATRLPVLDGSCGVVCSVFAPHPFDEFRRVLRADGHWVTVTPGPHHLQEMRPVAQGEVAAERFARRAEPPPEARSAEHVQYTLDLSADAADDLFLMTPIRWQAGARAGGAMTVTVDVWVSRGDTA